MGFWILQALMNPTLTIPDLHVPVNLFSYYTVAAEPYYCSVVLIMESSCGLTFRGDRLGSPNTSLQEKVTNQYDMYTDAYILSCTKCRKELYHGLFTSSMALT